MGKDDEVVKTLLEFFPCICMAGFNDTVRQICGDDKRLSTLYFLGHIEAYLNLRNLSIPDKTLDEIGIKLGMRIDRYLVKDYLWKILQLEHELRRIYRKKHRIDNWTLLKGTCVKVMNEEMQLKGLMKEEIFQVKHRCLVIARGLVKSGTTIRPKDCELWVRAICYKALGEIFPDYPHEIFPTLDQEIFEVVKDLQVRLDTFISV
ncbi:MAG: hypothetical protein ACTSR2_10220 [Candidatus Hodarchaeales archaeon]